MDDRSFLFLFCALCVYIYIYIYVYIAQALWFADDGDVRGCGHGEEETATILNVKRTCIRTLSFLTAPYC